MYNPDFFREDSGAEIVDKALKELVLLLARRSDEAPTNIKGVIPIKKLSLDISNGTTGMNAPPNSKCFCSEIVLEFSL